MHDKIYNQQPWSQKAFEVAEKMTADLQKLLPYSKVHFTGALALKLPGKNDADISVELPTMEHSELLKSAPAISSYLQREPTHIEPNFVQWEYTFGDVEIDCILYSDKFPGMAEQMEIHRKLLAYPTLLEEYRELKDSYNGKPYEVYRRAKIDFFNRSLGMQEYKL